MQGDASNLDAIITIRSAASGGTGPKKRERSVIMPKEQYSSLCLSVRSLHQRLTFNVSYVGEQTGVCSFDAMQSETSVDVDHVTPRHASQ